MNKEIVSNRQCTSLIIFFMIGSSAMYTMASKAEQNFWVAIILGLILATPFAIMSARIHYLFPNESLFDVIDICFGKFIGNTLIIFFVFFNLYWAIDVSTNYKIFISTVTLPETPDIIPISFMIILCAWSAIKGVEVLGRWADFFIIVPFAVLIFSYLGLYIKLDTNNLKPFFAPKFNPLLEATFYVFMFPLTQLPTSFNIIISKFDDRHSAYKVYLGGLFFGGLILLLNSLKNVLVLGVNESSSLYYPSYIAASKINIADFIQRLEIIVALTFILGGFIKVSILIICICKGIAKIFNYSDYRFIVIPITLIIINLVYFQYSDIFFYYEFDTVWPYFAFPFQIIFPIIIWICAELKYKNLYKK